MKTENELILALLAGDEKAYHEFYNRFADRVYNTALSVLQHQQEAEDIVQEVFIEAYKSLGNFKQQATLKTWLYTIAVNKCYDAIKKRKAQKRFAYFTSLFGDSNELQHDAPNFNHPGVALENKEQAAILFYAINQLPINQKIAFTLAKIEGLSYKEIAASMKLSLSAVESLLFRANENLRDILSVYYKNNIQSGASNFNLFLLTL